MANDAIEQQVETLRQALASQREILLKQKLRNIASEVGAGEDHEYAERLSLVVKEISSLIHRGLDIHPAIGAPETTRSKFPSPKIMLEAAKQLVGPSNPSAES